MDFILNLIYIHPVASLFISLAIWIEFRKFWQRRVDAQFCVTVSGGRCGVIIVNKDQYTYRAEYKAGFTVDFIIDGSSLMTADKQPLSMQSRTELVEALSAWAKVRGTTLEIYN